MGGYVEKTLVLLKPDAFERGLVGEIMEIIDKRGLKLVGSKLIHMDSSMVKKHYKNHVGKTFFPDLVDFMTAGPSLALVYEGNQACHVVRQLIGEKHPTNSLPGSIRGRYASEYPRNLIHGSDESSEAMYEIDLYFDKSELFDSNYLKNKKKFEIAKAAKLKADKAVAMKKPVNVGEHIPYPEQVETNWTIVDDHGNAYRVLDTKKVPGGVELTLCSTKFIDTAFKDNYKAVLVYNDVSWSASTWKLLKTT